MSGDASLGGPGGDGSLPMVTLTTRHNHVHSSEVMLVSFLMGAADLGRVGQA
jgi:hypothetical protein